MRDYSLKEAAALMSVHPETLRRLARAGQLDGAYKVGRQWRIAEEALTRRRGEAQGRGDSPDEAAREEGWKPEAAVLPVNIPKERPRPTRPGR